MSEKAIQYVTWTAYGITLSALITIGIAGMGYLFNSNADIVKKVDAYVAQEKTKDETLSVIRADVAEIKTNIEWLKVKK